jgi:hypothetical protein
MAWRKFVQQNTIKIQNTSRVTIWYIGNWGHGFDPLVHRRTNPSKGNYDKSNKNDQWNQEFPWIVMWRAWRGTQTVSNNIMHFNHAYTHTHTIYEHSPQFLSSEPSGQSTMKSHQRDSATHCPPSKHFLLPSGQSSSSVRRKFWHVLWRWQIKILSTVKLQKYFFKLKTMEKKLTNTAIMKLKRTERLSI